MTIALTKTSVRLIGAPNFRDLGGYATSDGRTVMHGKVFRSGSLADLAVDDLNLLASTDLRFVCDLRSEHERALYPARWPPSCLPRELHLDLNTDLRAHNKVLGQILADDPTPSGGHRMMLSVYESLPQACTRRLAELFTELADAESSLPALICCTAGKDRTGFICALLLYALGVPEESIFEDYLLSGQRVNATQLNASVGPMMKGMLGFELTPETLNTINGVSPEYLAISFATMRARWGSIESYLLQAGGLDAERRERLHARLLQ